jgi:high-affinity Fe2+/Pb2+ permease
MVNVSVAIIGGLIIGVVVGFLIYKGLIEFK